MCGSARRGRRGRDFTRAPRVVDVSRRPIMTIEPDRPVCAVVAIDRNKRGASTKRLQKKPKIAGILHVQSLRSLMQSLRTRT